VRSITFAGTRVNLTMCTSLGANFACGSPEFKPWLQHPVTNEHVLIFWDPCHMLKLIRNMVRKGHYSTHLPPMENALTGSTSHSLSQGKRWLGFT